MDEIFFELGKYDITVNSKRKLNNMLLKYRSCGDCIITLSGFADDSGTDAFNEQLSWDRARIVELYFLENGVPTFKQHTTAYGKKGEGSYNQRKVVITIYAQTH